MSVTVERKRLGGGVWENGDESSGRNGPFESPSALQRLSYLIANPFKNYLIPAGVLRRAIARSRSKLIAASLARPGGWRAMEVLYRNEEPVDWFDRQALREQPISMAARNRRRIVIEKLAGLIRHYALNANVTVLGVGAGPGRHVQTAIVESGIDPARVTAYLVDLDDDAFEYGRNLAEQLEIAASIHFIQGDARRIRETLPNVAAHVVKLVGLVEYLTDEQFLDLLVALREVMVPGGTLLTHGLVDAYGTSPFLARVFNLRHRQRNAGRMQHLLQSAGFRTISCVTEPAGIHPILTAVPAYCFD